MHNRWMPHIYLAVDYKDKDAAKELGARWDAARRLWYVPAGLELEPFSQWMPSSGNAPAKTTNGLPATRHSAANELAVPAKKGVSLSSLLGGVSQVVAQAYRAGVWVLVDVVELRSNGGHVFMGVSERDTNGTVLAKTSAVIWQSTASTLLPAFERATGVQLAPGIKLLIRARPVFKALHGFTLEVDAIDPEYTLGDLEARKREIRQRLQAEGVFTANKRIPAPWDFNTVLVVAPAGGAGLGDFQAEASRLERFGVCQFVYTYSRFQGEGAAREICDTLQNAVTQWMGRAGAMPDAVVIIRGGGAVNDLAWLNDYDLARFICDLPVPVLTGIGHERDSTVLDEIAHTNFDTPSKVIAGIEKVIAKRTSEAKSYFEQVANDTHRLIQDVKASVTALDATIRTEAIGHLSKGKQSADAFITDVRFNAMREIRSASEIAFNTFLQVKSEAQMQVQQAKQAVPTLWQQVSGGARQILTTASVMSDSHLQLVLDEARRDASLAGRITEDRLTAIAVSARQKVREASMGSESLMREITGQGPEKTLRRGFALVRDETGKPITRVRQAALSTSIEIQFSDGSIKATAGKQI